MRALAAILLAGLAATLAGCGGGSKAVTGGTASGSAAAIAPADSAAFVAVDSDLSSRQWQAVDDLLDTFPAKSKLFEEIRAQLGREGLDYERDVEPALGSEIDFVWLDFATGGADVVGVTKPKDADKFDALLAKGATKSVHEVVRGWTVFADKRAAIDAFRSAANGRHLADNPRFKEALQGLPQQSLLKAYIDARAARAQVLSRLRSGTALPGAADAVWASAVLRAAEGGIRLDGRVKSESAPPNFTSKLFPDAPAGALLYVSFHGREHAVSALRRDASAASYLRELERMLGVQLDDLDPLLANEGELYVRPGTPVPDVTLAVLVDDEQKALHTLDTAIRKLTATGGTAPRPDPSSGISGARELPLGLVSLHYAAFDGKLVLTTAPTGLRALRDGGSNLRDDADFKEAARRVGLPDSNSGFVYADLTQSVPLLESLVAFTGSRLPNDVTRNAQPLRSFIAYAAGDGATERFSAFLGID